jgi:hypothetical protein
MGIWRLKGVRGNIDKRCLTCMQEGRRREPHPAMRRYKGLEGQTVGEKVYWYTSRDRKK